MDLIWTYRCFFWKLHETSDKLPPPACPALLVFWLFYDYSCSWVESELSPGPEHPRAGPHLVLIAGQSLSRCPRYPQLLCALVSGVQSGIGLYSDWGKDDVKIFRSVWCLFLYVFIDYFLWFDMVSWCLWFVYVFFMFILWLFYGCFGMLYLRIYDEYMRQFWCNSIQIWFKIDHHVLSFWHHIDII